MPAARDVDVSEIGNAGRGTDAGERCVEVSAVEQEERAAP